MNIEQIKEIIADFVSNLVDGHEDYGYCLATEVLLDLLKEK